MKQSLKVFAILTVIVSMCCGCTKATSVALTENDVMTYLKKSSDTSDVLTKSFIEKCKVSSIDLKDNGEYIVNIQYPDLSSIAIVASNDVSGYATELDNLSTKNASDDAKMSFVKSYFVKILGTEEYAYKSGSYNVTVNDYSAVMSIVNELNTFDYKKLISRQSSTNDTNVMNSKAEINSDESFVFVQNNSTFVVSDVSVKTGSDAVEAVNNLSAVNNYSASDGDYYYVTYNITNLSDTSQVVDNAFVLVNNGTKVVMKTDIVGLKSTNEIGPSEKKEFSCFLAGPVGSNLIWSNPDQNGSYIIHVVL